MAAGGSYRRARQLGRRVSLARLGKLFLWAAVTKNENCYHCGQPLTLGNPLLVRIDGEARAMCCGGCQAVAQAIVDNGLVDYYRKRDALPEAPREALPAIVEGLQLYDHADFQKSFVRSVGEDQHADQREASLILEGITCSACIWLNEQHLARLAGIVAVDINYATRRARVRWDERRIRLSEILAAIAAIGYRAYPYDAERSEQLARSERRNALWRVFVAGFGMMQVMMYAVPVYLAGAGEMTAEAEQLMRWASLVLTVPVIFYSAAPFFGGAWRDFRLRRVGMDVPVALGIDAAFVASVWATLRGEGEVYFDSVTMFVFFLLGGRYLEMTARQRAVSVTEALARLMPALATRVAGYPAQREGEQVVAGDLRAGDIVLVRPGETVPADGCVREGVSSTDEALLTGESAPVGKHPGDFVTGGAVNIESPLFVEVTQVGEATRLSAIVRLMERAAVGKPRIVELADRAASHFIIVLLVLAALAAVIWWYRDPAQVLWITVSVLVVSCPCALSLATPVALAVASGAMARAGLLVTRSHAVETLARANHFVFDKTGTLTSGRMKLLEVLPLGDADRTTCLCLAAALEQASEHPIAAALREAAGDAVLPAVESPSSLAGSGVSAVVAGRHLRLGRPDYAQAAHGRPLPASALPLLERADTVVALSSDTGWIALFRIGDELRAQAAALIAELRSGGRQVTLLTGDTAPAAARVAQTLAIDDVVADASPQAKHEHVRRLQAQGAVVAMVGDGVNDAPVLAQAQVSVAMGGGSQLARTQADLVLLSENLAHLARGVAVARRSLRVIRQNLLWSLAYNLVALPLAMAGQVTPWMAGIGMSASSLLVVANSLRLHQAART